VSPRKRSGRVARLVLWGGLGLWALALAVFYVTRPARAAARPGDQMLTAAVTGHGVDGGELLLLPRDSVVAVLAATSECDACRVGLPSYRDIAARLRSEGVAFRVIVGSDSLAARQFSRLLPDPGAVVRDGDQTLFRKIGVRMVPSLYLVGRDGRLMQSWEPLRSEAGIAEVIVSAAREAR
jgi:hypothetical protein